MRFLSSIAWQRCQGLLSFRPLGCSGKEASSWMLLAFFAFWNTVALLAHPAEAPVGHPASSPKVDWTSLVGMSLGEFNANISANPTTITAGNPVL